MHVRWQPLHQRPPQTHLISPRMASLRCRLHLLNPVSPHLHSPSCKNKKVSDQRLYLQLFTHRPCMWMWCWSMTGGLKKSFWSALVFTTFYLPFMRQYSTHADGWICHPLSLDELFSSSRVCSFYAWILEDFPGYNFNRFHLSVIRHCNRIWQTYILLVLFHNHLWLSLQWS